jgi:REP element-mobilizing transposase RayT
MVERRRSIIAHHLILPLYGHWAPNDLRGSGSTELYNEKFESLGAIHLGRKPEREQPSRGELREFHRKFKAILKHPVFWIDDAKRQAIAQAFGEVVRREGYTVYACAICSNHAHLVIRIHRDDAVTMWNRFADESRLRLRAFFDLGAGHPVWAEHPYQVFLFTPEEAWGRIRYVENNPLKEGLPAQKRGFVMQYDNWPLHRVGRGEDASVERNVKPN